MKDWLSFDKMITPIILKILYVLALIAVVISAVVNLFHGQFFHALAILVFGVIGTRVYCELLILLFRIHENLVEINHNLKKPSGRADAPQT